MPTSITSKALEKAKGMAINAVPTLFMPDPPPKIQSKPPIPIFQVPGVVNTGAAVLAASVSKRGSNNTGDSKSGESSGTCSESGSNGMGGSGKNGGGNGDAKPGATNGGAGSPQGQEEQTGHPKPKEGANPEPAAEQTTTAGSPTEAGMCSEKDRPKTPEDEWREKLRGELEDENAQMSWRDPTTKALADGKIDEDEHLNRNAYNYCPDTKPPVGEQDGIDWQAKNGISNLYHQPLECYKGKPTDGSLGPGAFECCYDPKTAAPVLNCDRSGTYDFDGGSGFNAPLLGPLGDHGKYDVAPHEDNSNYSHVNMTCDRPGLIGSTTQAAGEEAQNALNAGTKAVGNVLDYTQKKGSELVNSVAGFLD